VISLLILPNDIFLNYTPSPLKMADLNEIKDNVFPTSFLPFRGNQSKQLIL